MSSSQQSALGVFKDALGRELSYVRISLTNRCNMECVYCGARKSATCDHVPELDVAQLLELIAAFSHLGIDKFRFTGGEPLLRSGVLDLVRVTSALDGVSIVGLTTNGLLLDTHLDPLVDAGLNRLNVSLDTLDPERFERMTGVDGFSRVMQGIKAAVESNAFERVKVNSVIMRGFNDDEVTGFCEWAIQAGLDIRFIEFMPTRHASWSEKLFVGEKEIRDKIRLPLEPDASKQHNNGPATTFFVPGQPGRVSFISPVTTSFCGSCNRLRVTSSGDIVGCLFGDSQFDCRSLLGRNLDTEEIAGILAAHITRSGFRRTPSEQSITTTRPSMRGIGG